MVLAVSGAVAAAGSAVGVGTASADGPSYNGGNCPGGMTCTHCGRCTSVCPANITGKVLDPKQIIIQMNHRTLDKAPLMVGESGTLIQRANDEAEKEQAEAAGAAVFRNRSIEVELGVGEERG